MEKINVSECNSGIRIECEKNGIKEIGKIGIYSHPEHADSADWQITVYMLPSGYRVADTNGDPVWEENDASGFEDMLEEYGAE